MYKFNFKIQDFVDFVVISVHFAVLICAAILEEPENEYDTEATKKAKDLYASCVDIRKYFLFFVICLPHLHHTTVVHAS